MKVTNYNLMLQFEYVVYLLSCFYVIMRFLLTDEHLQTICTGCEQFSVNVPNLFSLTEHLPLTNPPRRLFSKIGFWNFFAFSPAVKQMQRRLPHTQLRGWQITCRCSRAWEMWTASSACFSDSRMLLMSTLRN